VGADALTTPVRGRVGRLVDFLRDVRAEIRKVTWPTREEIRKATTVIIAFVSVLGLAIGLLDTVLQFLLVRMVARIF
jgi:preprotein translocase subunit SecE